MKGGKYKMEKSIFKSKTFLGFGAMLLVGGLTSAGWLDSSVITTALQTAGGIVGVWGARDALE